ncbi:hypothetical protein HOY82DRAFT_610609 [Tuber indicum]|nr:hypothetical protein HOY82DRAFT_610609 [Tuber indicum]
MGGQGVVVGGRIMCFFWAGGSNEKAEAGAGGSEDSEPAYCIDEKAGRLTEEVERGLSVANGLRESVMEDLSIREAPMPTMVDLSGRWVAPLASPWGPRFDSPGHQGFAWP